MTEFEEGMNAFYDHGDPDLNPYTYDPKKEKNWDDGFYAAGRSEYPDEDG